MASDESTLHATSSLMKSQVQGDGDVDTNLLQKIRMMLAAERRTRFYSAESSSIYRGNTRIQQEQIPRFARTLSMEFLNPREHHADQVPPI